MALCRIGKMSEALEALNAATELLTKLQNDRYHSNLLRERAVVLHRMGLTCEARASIGMAIELTKEADELSLRRTYNVAAGILDDKQLSTMAKKKGRQVKRHANRSRLATS
jgi:predicted RNA polymerase sigma factor